MNKFKPGLSNLIIYIIIFLSLWNLFNELSATTSVLSILISVIGLLAASLFFLDNNWYKKLIWIWIAAQVVIISKSGSDPETGIVLFNDIIFDCSQAVNVKFGFYMKADSTAFSINFNVLVLIYFFLLKQLKTSAHIGKSYVLGAQSGSPLEAQLSGDLIVFITDQLRVDGDKNWLAGTLSMPIMLNEKEYDRVVIQVEKTLLSNLILAVPSDYDLQQKANSSATFEARNWLYIKM